MVDSADVTKRTLRTVVSTVLGEEMPIWSLVAVGLHW